MDGPRRSGPTPTEARRGPLRWRPSWGYLGAALVIVVGGLALAWWATPAPPDQPLLAQAPRPSAPDPAVVASPPASATRAASAASAAIAASDAVSAAPRRIARARDPNGDLTPDIADYVNEGEQPTMAEVIERLHQAGVYGGLGAFPPPGTRPPLVGLAVPEDFPLPDGYVRHYQATDDGQRIEPILMFAPDRTFVDAANRPIAIPDNRVVPPELAPPGLPLRRIVVPAPVESGRPAR